MENFQQIILEDIMIMLVVIITIDVEINYLVVKLLEQTIIIMIQEEVVSLDLILITIIQGHVMLEID